MECFHIHTFSFCFTSLLLNSTHDWRDHHYMRLYGQLKQAFACRMLFLTPNQKYQCNEGHSKHYQVKEKIMHWTPCFSDPSTPEGRDSQPFMSRRQWREKAEANEERKTVVFIWAPFSFSAVFVTGEDTAEDTRDDSLDSDSNKHTHKA